jgi:hypothetical protein
LKIKDVQPDKYLGEILFRIGVPQDKINSGLYYSSKRKSIGEILIDLHMISTEQLEEALNRQKSIRENSGQNKPLGLLLIEMGHINIYGYLTVLSKHFNMPLVTSIDFEPSFQLQRVLGQKYAREHRIIVMENGTDIIKLVLAEPSMQLMEELQRLFLSVRGLSSIWLDTI